jgi:hypothetical protein
VVCSVNLISLQYSFLMALGADLVCRLAGMRDGGGKGCWLEERLYKPIT